MTSINHTKSNKELAFRADMTSICIFMRPNRELASRLRKNIFVKQIGPIETWPPNQSIRKLGEQKNESQLKASRESMH